MNGFIDNENLEKQKNDQSSSKSPDKNIKESKVRENVDILMQKEENTF
jgi:hypothetical protein